MTQIVPPLPVRQDADEPPTASRNEHRSASALRWTAAKAGLLLGLWWLAAFTATHMPMPDGEDDLDHWDKVAHFSMYAGLALLASVWLIGRRRLPGCRTAAAIAAVLFCYAVFDELTQIPVGRDADVWDAVADMCGVAAGLGGFAALRWLWRRKNREVGGEGAEHS